MPVLTHKRTKILATVGPASESVEVLTRMVEAGANAFRINFSHGDNKQRLRLLENIRQVERELDSPLAVLGDLSGPKIRVGEIEGDGVTLEEGAIVVFQREEVVGTAERVTVTLPELFDVIEIGDPVLLWDGRLRLRVCEVEPGESFRCLVEQGGELKSRKGVNLPGTLLPISALTEKDKEDAAWIAEHDFDYVALSFVQKPDDLRELRAFLRERGGEQMIVAKVEKPQALACISSIIEASDCIMVARGDLGVEMDFPSVPVAQKAIAEKCQAAGIPCIIATEMLESMITASRPTRAEVSDVANAVFDNADAVMLSAESSVGDYPVEAVRAMRDTLRAAEAHQVSRSRGLRLGKDLEPPILAALLNSFHVIHGTVEVAAIAVITDSGRTARLVAKTRPPCPVVAFSEDIRAVRRSCLYYGVVTIQVDVAKAATQRELMEFLQRQLKAINLADTGDRVLLTGYYPFGSRGSTNTLAIIEVD